MSEDLNEYQQLIDIMNDSELGRELDTLEKQVAEVKERRMLAMVSLQSKVFSDFGIKFGSKIMLDMKSDGNKDEYTVLDVNIVDNKPTIRVVSKRTELNASWHSDHNRFDDEFAENYGTDIRLEEFADMVSRGMI